MEDSAAGEGSHGEADEGGEEVGVEGAGHEGHHPHTQDARQAATWHIAKWQKLELQTINRPILLSHLRIYKDTMLDRH